MFEDIADGIFRVGAKGFDGLHTSIQNNKKRILQSVRKIRDQAESQRIEAPASKSCILQHLIELWKEDKAEDQLWVDYIRDELESSLRTIF